MLNQFFLSLCKGDGSDLQSALAEWTGQKTVPNVFVKGERIGGCDGESSPSEILLLYRTESQENYCVVHCVLGSKFVLTMVLTPAEQLPWQCTTVGSWCLCWRRLEQLPVPVPRPLPLRLYRQSSTALSFSWLGGYLPLLYTIVVLWLSLLYYKIKTNKGFHRPELPVGCWLLNL